MGFFDFNSPVMRFIGKACEYMLVALLCLVFSIPVFTIGAAVTAQYYVGIKLIKGEDVPFFKAYIKSFKENFKQATVIWLGVLLLAAFFSYDWYLIYNNGGDNYNLTMKILLAIICLFVAMAALAAFALLSRFEMSTKEILKGAFAYTYTNIPRMLIVLILTVLPSIASFKHSNWLIPLWPVGSAMCLYLISYNYMKSFKKLEMHVLGEDEEEAEAEISDTID